MKKILFFVTVLALLFIGCEMSDDSGDSATMTLNLTDAPALPMSFGEITDVNIKIDRVEISVNDEWFTLVDFPTATETGEFDLLDLQEGTVAALADEIEIPSGTIGQIRFYLDAAEDDSQSSACYITYTADEGVTYQTMDVYIPSAQNSGLKFVGGFDAPSNGEVDITADFDVRKSLKYVKGQLKMNPTIKLIVSGEAGHISGTVTGDTSAYSNVAVYAYEDGTYSAAELAFDLTDSSEDNDIPLLNSVGTAGINDDGSFTIAYLAEGTYDLYLAGLLITDPVTEAGNYTLLASLDDSPVVAGEMTSGQDITIP
ncbi:MAG: DUF4382 domain-containing protein [Spirochaetales bacterium]|nr:DUF4382 domain-containing protein [Spirochaetales bacterium]